MFNEREKYSNKSNESPKLVEQEMKTKNMKLLELAFVTRSDIFFSKEKQPFLPLILSHLSVFLKTPWSSVWNTRAEKFDAVLIYFL